MIGLQVVDFETEPNDTETRLDFGNPPQWGGGWRWFPGSYTFGGPTHHVIRAKATADWGIDGEGEADLAHCPCYFEWYDVDDPYTNQAPIDTESNQFDNRGGPSAPNPTWQRDEASFDSYDTCVGTPLWAGTQPSPDGLVKGQAAVTFLLESRYQPGDNFRVVASLVSTDDPNYEVKAFHSATNGAVSWRTFYQGTPGAWSTVDDGTNEKEIFKSTPLLTVWRYLHVEGDWMGAPGNGENFDDGTQDAQMKDVPPPIVGPDPYNEAPPDPGPAQGDLFGPLPPPDLGLLTSALLDAYIEVIQDTEFDSSIGFIHNVEAAMPLGNRQVQENANYWAAYICIGYEWRANLSLDPSTPNPNSDFGVGRTNTLQQPGESMVFFETLRDWLHDSCGLYPGLSNIEFRQAMIAHEIGHQLQINAHDGGLMGSFPHVKCKDDLQPREYMPHHIAGFRGLEYP